ncbi:MAG: hypothetical protein LIP77_02595, partial [Planctomycetes bacterium]|nr:hypothetical protein [Planctomycetota bacterium]
QETGASDAQPGGWLSQIDPGEYNYGVDSVNTFTGAYEIISSARRKTETGRVDVRMPSEATVRTVVSLSFSSSMNDLNQLAVLHTDSPSGLVGDTKESNLPADYDSISSMNFIVSGEDHYSFKASKKDVIREEVIEGLAAIANVPSQLYSVVNDTWNIGRLTMHFQHGTEYNPQIPRTPYFRDDTWGIPDAGNVIHQQMEALNPDEEVWDELVFGGKYTNIDYEVLQESGSYLRYGYGRSVEVGDDGLITVTRGADSIASVYAEKALAVGTVDNVLKFYLNFVDADFPAASATQAQVDSWKENYWRQLPIGYHTKNKTKNTNLNAYRRPLDNKLSDARRRWTVLLWIKDQSGRFLVRDASSWDTPSNLGYSTSDDPLRTSYPVPNTAWNGRYRWAMYGGYPTSSSTDGGNYHIGNFSVNDTHASSKQTIHTRILTLEEMLGYQLYVDADGVPAKYNGNVLLNPPANRVLSDDQIVAGVPDYYRDSDGKLVPLLFHGSTQFNEDYQRAVRADNWMANTSYLPTIDGHDNSPNGIHVYDDRDGKVTDYYFLKDFAFTVDINGIDNDPQYNGLTDEEKEALRDWREMVLLHMVIEEDAEVDAVKPNMYFDMGFTVTLVYPKTISVDVDDDDEFLIDAFRHWWQGNHEESLTGYTSHYAVSSLMDRNVVIGLNDDVEKMKAYYSQLGLYDPDDEDKITASIYTMIAPTDGNNHTGFGVASFGDEEPQYGKIILATSGLPKGTVFHYGRDILFYYFGLFKERFLTKDFNTYLKESGQWDEITADQNLYNEALMEWRTAKALTHMAGNNPGMQFVHIDKRWNNTDSVYVGLSAENMQQVFKFPNKDITSRYFAGQAFGEKTQTVPAVYAKYGLDNIRVLRYSDLNSSAGNDEYVVMTKGVGFLPGEMVHDGSDSLTQDPDVSHVEMMAKTGVFQYNGRPLEPKFIWDAKLSPDEEDISNLQDWPEWLQVVTASGETLQTLILEEYELEQRGAIGTHREGPVPIPPSEPENGMTVEEYALAYGDNYEYVIMTQRGFNPFQTLTVDGKTVVAFTHPKDGPGVSAGDWDVEEFQPALKRPSEMPTFLIEGAAVDGAGILVVNGNLDLRTNLAYHGVLVVMGDLTVTPASYNALDADGNVVDKDGNVLTYNHGTWQYQDEDGAMQVSYPVTEWRGQLVVQGKVLVGGTVTLNHDVDGVPSYVEGDLTRVPKIDIRGSRQAVDETVGTWSKVAPSDGLTTDRLGWSSGTVSSSVGGNLWN